MRVTTGSRWTRMAITLYGVLALLSLGLALARLWQSADLPGLAALELVVLALPWSLLLGVPPLAHAPLVVGASVVLLGVIVNGALVAALVRGAELVWRGVSRR